MVSEIIDTLDRMRTTLAYSEDNMLAVDAADKALSALRRMTAAAKDLIAAQLEYGKTEADYNQAFEALRGEVDAVESGK